MRLDETWLITLSDLFVNLSAGWFGALFIVPVTSKRPERVRLGLLTVNLLFAIISLLLALKFKKWASL